MWDKRAKIQPLECIKQILSWCEVGFDAKDVNGKRILLPEFCQPVSIKTKWIWEISFTPLPSISCHYNWHFSIFRWAIPSPGKWFDGLQISLELACFDLPITAITFFTPEIATMCCKVWRNNITPDWSQSQSSWIDVKELAIIGKAKFKKIEDILAYTIFFNEIHCSLGWMTKVNDRICAYSEQK